MDLFSKLTCSDEEPRLFRVKPQIVEAMVYKQDKHYKSMLGTWVAASNATAIWRYDGTFGIKFEVNGKTETLDPKDGDIIVRQPSGRFLSLTPEQFAAQYEGIV